MSINNSPVISLFWYDNNCYFVAVMRGWLSLPAITDFFHSVYVFINNDDKLKERMKNSMVLNIANVSEFLFNNPTIKGRLVVRRLLKLLVTYKPTGTIDCRFSDVCPTGRDCDSGEVLNYLNSIIEEELKHYSLVQFIDQYDNEVKFITDYNIFCPNSIGHRNSHNLVHEPIIMFNSAVYVELKKYIQSDCKEITEFKPGEEIFCEQCNAKISKIITVKFNRSAIFDYCNFDGYGGRHMLTYNIPLNYTFEVKNKGQTKKFILRAYLVSSSGGESGHYWVYVLCNDNKWYEFNFNSIRVVNEPLPAVINSTGRFSRVTLFYDVQHK